MEDINIVERMKTFRMQGLAVTIIKEKTIFKSDYYGVYDKHLQAPVTKDTLFSACSISKLLTAVLTCKLIDEQLLQLDTPVNQLLTTWTLPSDASAATLTLRQLLSHQSGIIDPPDSFLPYHKIWGYPTIEQLFHGETAYCPEPIRRHEEQVGDFHYADANFCLIEKIIEEVTGRSFTALMDEKIFQPLGMTSSTFMISQENHVSQGHDRNGESVKEKYPFYPYPAASGLWSTSTDLSRLVIELMEALDGNSKLCLSPLTINEMFTPQREQAWVGLGCFLENTPKGVEVSSLGWGVGFQSLLAIYPKTKEGIVILTNTELGVHQMNGLIGEIYRSFIGEKREKY